MSATQHWHEQAVQGGVRVKWMEFMTETINWTGNVIHESTRRDMSDWAAAVCQEMQGLLMLRNEWQKTLYCWFLGEPQDGGNEVDVVNEGGDNDYEEYKEGGADNDIFDDDMTDDDKGDDDDADADGNTAGKMDAYDGCM
jgi:hypothetical protein